MIQQPSNFPGFVTPIIFDDLTAFESWLYQEKVPGSYVAVAPYGAQDQRKNVKMLFPLACDQEGGQSLPQPVSRGVTLRRHDEARKASKASSALSGSTAQQARQVKETLARQVEDITEGNYRRRDGVPGPCGVKNAWLKTGLGPCAAEAAKPKLWSQSVEMQIPLARGEEGMHSLEACELWSYKGTEAALIALKGEDPSAIVIVLGLNKLRSAAQKLDHYFSSYGQLKSMHVAHTQQILAPETTVAASIVFVVMGSPAAAKVVISEGPTHFVKGHAITVHPFEDPAGSPDIDA
jgi:hypothetical protein